MKVANPTENITNPWEAKMKKVMNPMKENVVEANLYLLEVKNCPRTPMGEGEEEMMLMSCLLEANLKLLVLPKTCCLIEAAVVVLYKIWYQMPMSYPFKEAALKKVVLHDMAEAVVQIGNSIH